MDFDCSMVFQSFVCIFHLWNNGLLTHCLQTFLIAFNETWINYSCKMMNYSCLIIHLTIRVINAVQYGSFKPLITLDDRWMRYENSICLPTKVIENDLDKFK